MRTSQVDCSTCVQFSFHRPVSIPISVLPSATLHTSSLCTPSEDRPNQKPPPPPLSLDEMPVSRTGRGFNDVRADLHAECLRGGGDRRPTRPSSAQPDMRVDAIFTSGCNARRFFVGYRNPTQPPPPTPPLLSLPPPPPPPHLIRTRRKRVEIRGSLH